MSYGIQLYSVRDLAQGDLRSALEQVARIGYQSVEFAGFFGNPAKDVREWLNGCGLAVSGTHTALDALARDYKGVVKYHQDIGCSRLIIPYAAPKTRDECKALLETMAGYRDTLAREGIALAYHNHAHEFKPIEGGLSLWDSLLTQTAIPLEADTYWVYAAGADPVAWMETLHSEGRLPVIHIKDGLADGRGTPLGQGTAPVEAVYRTALRLGVPMVVESETLTPTGLEEARVCIRYLNTLDGTVSA